MAKVIKTIAPENNMEFDRIYSFQTENHIGIWSHIDDCFLVVAKSGREFYRYEVQNCDSLEDLDDKVFDICDEHIEDVFESGAYTFTLAEEV